MSQEIILNWLTERSPRKFTASQIVYFMAGQASQSAVFANLRKLRMQNKIKYELSNQYNHNEGFVKYYYVEVE